MNHNGIDHRRQCVLLHSKGYTSDSNQATKNSCYQTFIALFCCVRNIQSSGKKKLIERLKRKPKDFTWSELINLLTLLGYSQAKGGKSAGSRRRFVHPTAPVITLHQPHPDPAVKSYVIDDILDLLTKEEGML